MIDTIKRFFHNERLKRVIQALTLTGSGLLVLSMIMPTATIYHIIAGCVCAILAIYLSGKLDEETNE
ncbi:MAG: hypothetical protein CSB28_00665 [Desulfobacterales bacterium]|nr:MAG: hypothetical protein CSB28_00665 [Desulfobacterales bacterium]